jgi:hypothetical protein
MAEKQQVSSCEADDGGRSLRCASVGALAVLLGVIGNQAAAGIVTAPARATPVHVSDAVDRLHVVFNNGDAVVFERSGDRYRQLGLTVAGQSYTLDLADCQPFGPVATDTLTLSPDDETRSAGTFTLLFQAGSEADVRFGELPRVQISFGRREPSLLLITRKTSARASYSDRLCSWRTPHEKANMRAHAEHEDTLARGTELATPELLDRFRTTQFFWQQREVGEFLIARRDPEVTHALASMLGAEDRHVRANAAYVLAGQGDPRGLDALFWILDDRSERACSQGVTVAPCTPESQRVSDRHYAIHLLGKLRDPRAIPVLGSLIGDPEVGYAVPWALRQIGTPEAVASLLFALDDPNPRTRMYAIQSLQEMRAREAVPRLRAMRNDTVRPNPGLPLTVGDAARAAVADLERRPEPTAPARR